MKILLALLCVAGVTLPAATFVSSASTAIPPLSFTEEDVDGHWCELQPATSLDACEGSRDCFDAQGNENCQLPADWEGPTNDKCVCPTPAPQ